MQPNKKTTFTSGTKSAMESNDVPGELLAANTAVREWLHRGPGYLSETGDHAEQELWSKAWALFSSDTGNTISLNTFKFCLRNCGFTVLAKGEGVGDAVIYFNFPNPPQDFVAIDWRHPGVVGDGFP